MTLMDLQTLSHSNSLQARSVDYLVGTVNFIKTYEQSNDTQRIQLERGVRDLDVALINTVIRSVTHDCIESLNIHELRNIAYKYGIYGATKIQKLQLINLIKQERNKRNEEDNQD